MEAIRKEMRGLVREGARRGIEDAIRTVERFRKAQRVPQQDINRLCEDIETELIILAGRL